MAGLARLGVQRVEEQRVIPYRFTLAAKTTEERKRAVGGRKQPPNPVANSLKVRLGACSVVCGTRKAAQKGAGTRSLSAPGPSSTLWTTTLTTKARAH